MTLEIGGAASEHSRLAVRRKQQNGTVADVTVTLNLTRPDVRRQVLNYIMTTSALVVLMAPGHHYTAASSPMDCWYTASPQNYADTIPVFGQLAEQQSTPGTHLFLYQPYEISLCTVEPWVTPMKDGRIQHMMYRRNQCHSPAQQCAWLPHRVWD